MATPPAAESPYKGKMQIKVYLVCQWNSLARPGEPNVRVIAARLTRSAAQNIVDSIPGTFIDKQLAVK